MLVFGKFHALPSDKGQENTHLCPKTNGCAFRYRRSQPFSELDTGMLVFGHLHTFPNDKGRKPGGNTITGFLAIEAKFL